MNLVNNELQFMNNIGYVINLNICIYYGGAPRRSGAPRRVCHFIPYYIIIIPFKTYIINSIIHTLQFMNNIGYVVNLNIHIYYSGAPRRSGAPRHVCHFIPYYSITILFKTYIMNSIIYTLHFVSNTMHIINMNIRIYCSGAPR